MNSVFYLHDENDPVVFEQTLLWFKRHYNLISLNTLRRYIRGEIKLKNSCALTIDDGWRSTYDVIFPIMRKHNVPFAIFVSPEIVKNETNFWYYLVKYCNEEDLKDLIIDKGLFRSEVRRYPIEMILKNLQIDVISELFDEYLREHSEIDIPRGFINTSEMLEMHRSGLVEIGAHTINHPILQSENTSRATLEIKKSVEDLSSLIGCAVTSFAYPNGIEGVDFGSREKIIARDCGIDMAFTVNPGAITPHVDNLSIPRWGSVARIKFGRIGKYLPSRMRQVKIRSEISKYKI